MLSAASRAPQLSGSHNKKMYCLQNKEVHGEGDLGFKSPSAGQNTIKTGLLLSALHSLGAGFVWQLPQGLTCSSFRKHRYESSAREGQGTVKINFDQTSPVRGSLLSPRNKSVLAPQPRFITGWKPPWEAQPQVLRDCQSVGSL